MLSLISPFLLLHTLTVLLNVDFLLSLDFESCGFETDTCNWITQPAASSGWNVSSGSRGGSQKADITFWSKYGKYMETEVNGESDSQILATLLSLKDDVCGLEFYYAKTSGTLELGFAGKPHVPLDRADDWTHRVVQLNASNHLPLSSSLLQFAFRADGSVGRAALDNIRFISCQRCTFEWGFCDWTGWSIVMASSVPNGGPIYDTTLWTTSGHLAHVKPGKKVAAFVGRTLEYKDNICSLGFNYLATGLPDLSLFVALQVDDGTLLNKMTLPLTERKWKFQRFAGLSLAKMQKFRFVFYAQDIHGSSDVSLDDIEYYACPSFDKCHFSNNLCGWTQDRIPSGSSNHVPWTLQSTGLVAHFPRYTKRYRTVATLTAITIAGVCSLEATFDFAGSFHSSVIYIDAGMQHTAFHPSAKTSRKEIQVDSSAKQITIVALRNYYDYGEITIHSLQFLSCLYTSFEHESGLSWHRLQPGNWKPTLSSDCTAWTHCMSDHTYGSSQAGHYAEFYFNNEMRMGNLLTAVSDKNFSVCGIRFWVYYTSVYLNAVKLFLHMSSENESLPVYPCESGSWRYRELVMSSEPLRLHDLLLFEAEGPLYSYLALDDIELTECPVFAPCDFERGLCGWTVVQDDSYNVSWFRSNAFPVKQTDEQGGQHLVLPASSEGIVKGVPISPLSGICGLDFSYFYEGSNVTSWVEIVLLHSNSSSAIKIWRSNEKTVSWRYVKVSLDVQEPSHVEFRGRTNVDTFFALDDLSYISCLNMKKEASAAIRSSLSPIDHKPSIKFPTKAASTPKSPKHYEISTSPPKMATSTSKRLSTEGIPIQQQSPGTFPSKGLTSGATAQPSAEKRKASDSGFPYAIVAGSVGGGIVLLIAAVVLFVTCQRRNESKRLAASPYVSKDQNIYSDPVSKDQNIYADPDDPVNMPWDSGSSEPVYAIPHAHEKTKSQNRNSENFLYSSPVKTDSDLSNQGNKRDSENIIYDSSDH